MVGGESVRDYLSNYQSQVVGLGVIILHLNFRAIKEQEVVASTFHAKFVIERLHPGGSWGN